MMKIISTLIILIIASGCRQPEKEPTNTQPKEYQIKPLGYTITRRSDQYLSTKLMNDCLRNYRWNNYESYTEVPDIPSAFSLKGAEEGLSFYPIYNGKKRSLYVNLEIYNKLDDADIRMDHLLGHIASNMPEDTRCMELYSKFDVPVFIGKMEPRCFTITGHAETIYANWVILIYALFTVPNDVSYDLPEEDSTENRVKKIATGQMPAKNRQLTSSSKSKSTEKSSDLEQNNSIGGAPQKETRDQKQSVQQQMLLDFLDDFFPYFLKCAEQAKVPAPESSK